MSRRLSVIGLLTVCAAASLATATAAPFAATDIAAQPFGPAFPDLDGWATGAWWENPAATTAKPGAKGGRPFLIDVPRQDVIAFAVYTVTVRPGARGALKRSAQLDEKPGGHPVPSSAIRADDWRLVRFSDDGRRARDKTAATPQSPRVPNVLFVIADDASCHFGAYGCRWTRTPAVDRLAREGIVFDNAYVPTSKCAPCRAAILTGRNPWQLEAAANHWPTFPPESMAFTEVLAARGLACGGAGKVWGPGVALTPSGDQRTWGLSMMKRGKGNDPGSAFRAFLGQRQPGQPFFYWYGSKAPHRPYKADAGLAAGKKPADIDRVPACWPDTDVVRRDMLDYATEIEAFDAEVGSLLTALEAAGEQDNTLVVVTSDHGMPFPRIKGHTFDLAHRVPLVMRWPAGVVHPGRRADGFVSAIDFAPTILDLESVDGVAAGMRPITGSSLADILRDAPEQPRDRVILGRERNDVRCRPGIESGLGYPARAIRRGNLFYVHNFAPDRWPCGDPDLGLADTDAGPTKALIEAAGQGDRFWQLCFGKRPADELYDLAVDPDCVTNLAADPARAADVRRLKEELVAELTRQEDPRVLGRGDMFDKYPSPRRADK
ncbi:MAG: sulfatase [Planctomycetia bacterium]